MSDSPTMDVQSLDVSTVDSSTLRLKVLENLPMPLQHVIAAILRRARDPKPEEAPTSHTSDQKADRLQAITWGWLPIVALTSALGMLSVAYAYINARYGATGVESFFWLGLLLIFVPCVVRLISPRASRFERIGLLCVVGICLSLVKVMYSPLYFSGYDEFLHWRTADDIARSGHLFSVNALLPVSPDYPGLEIVTNALSTLSGLSTFSAGIIVICAARLVMILSLFMLAEQITKSARMAGIATILYMANPHFLFFDAQFAYESLALPIATFMLFVMARVEMSSLLPARLKQMATFRSPAVASRKRLDSDLRWVTFVAWIALGAVVVTHHVTDFIFDGFLILWAVMHAFLHGTSLLWSNLVKTTLFGVFISVIYVVLVANPVVGYLSAFFIGTLNEIGRVVTGTSGARQLFVEYGGGAIPLWERIVSFSTVALILSGLPLGLLCLWKRYRSSALACVLGIVSLIYPISLALHFTISGGEISDRIAPFLFISIACLLAIFITQFWPTRWLNWKQTTLITCAISVVFLGGVIVGSGQPWLLLPGRYLVSADQRSIEPEGIQAALWAGSYLGPNNRIATDRINQLLMSTYGDERIVTSQEDNIDVVAVFFSSHLGPNESAILRRAKVRYLVIDLRLAYALPEVGFYFEPFEPGAFHHIAPIDLQDLTKFDAIPQINRVFDSGDIVIYDLGGLANAP